MTEEQIIKELEKIEIPKYETIKFNNTRIIYSTNNNEDNNNNIRAIKDVEDVLCVLIGFDKFIGSLSAEDKNKFINIINKSKDSLKVHFIFIDIPSGFKPYEFEAWYKATINPSTGLWVGDGFAEQYLLKPTKVIQDYYEIIGNDFGYIIENGQVIASGTHDELLKSCPEYKHLYISEILKNEREEQKNVEE